MEMFVLSYVNVLCIYPKLGLQVCSTLSLRNYLTKQYVISGIVSLIYVNKIVGNHVGHY